MKRVLGFTLIELMVTIAIIGILASLAIPAYQNHVVKARVTEGLQLAAVAKHDVSEEIVANQGILPDSMGKGYKSPASTENVKSVEITPVTGDITITYTAKAGDGTIILHPVVSQTGEISWECKEGSLDSKYRPSNCRK